MKQRKQIVRAKENAKSHIAEILTIPIFAESYRFSRPISEITILDVKILANNDFEIVPDKIKELTPTCTPIWRHSRET